MQWVAAKKTHKILDSNKEGKGTHDPLKIGVLRIYSSGAVSLIWGGKEAANKNVQFSCLPSCGYKQSSKRQVPTKVNTTQNRVQRIPQESNYFVFRQLKISCREGGGSTTGE